MSVSHVAQLDRTGEPFEFSAAGEARHHLGQMAGRSTVMQRLFTQVRFTAPHLRVAVIEGPAGAGKHLLARTLHECASGSGHSTGLVSGQSSGQSSGQGARGAAPFVPCMAAEFFSSEGATLLAEAAGGTLYLARVNEISAAQQGRFHDFLEWLEHQHARGGQRNLPRRVLAGSLGGLRRMAAAGQMHSRLCHRLTALSFVLPPLTERREDLAFLAEHFVRLFAREHGKPMRGLAPGTAQRLFAHRWPGNVRELRGAIYSAALACEGQWVRPIDLPPLQMPLPAGPGCAMSRMPALASGMAGAAGREAGLYAGGAAADSRLDPHLDASLDPNLDKAILRHVHAVLGQVNGNKLRAAQMLGISRSTLYRMLEDDASGTRACGSGD